MLAQNSLARGRFWFGRFCNLTMLHLPAFPPSPLEYHSLPILNFRAQGEGTDPNGNKVPLPEQVALQQAGPCVPIVLSPLEEHIQSLAAQRADPLPLLNGLALIDTGASVTCIDRKAAEKAGLTVVDSGPMHSATHTDHIVPIYAGMIQIQTFPAFRTTRAYGAYLEAQGIIALIGRDILASCTFIYNGADGSFSLAF